MKPQNTDIKNLYVITKNHISQPKLHQLKIRSNQRPVVIAQISIIDQVVFIIEACLCFQL